MNNEDIRQVYTFREVKKRSEWTDEHARWLSQFLQIDIQAFSFVVDLISGNPYLIFSTSEDLMPANKAVVKTQLLDEERMAILMNILECKKKDAL